VVIAVLMASGGGGAAKTSKATKYTAVPVTKLPPTIAAHMTASTTLTPTLRIAYYLKSGFDVDPDDVQCTPREGSLDIGDQIIIRTRPIGS
jgi:hypothetical protein